VSRKVETQNAYSQIDVAAQAPLRPHPHLVETVKGYATHEKETFGKCGESPLGCHECHWCHDKAAAENQLTGTLKTLFAVAEAIPSSKANTNFLALQEELSATENRIGFFPPALQRRGQPVYTTLMHFPPIFLPACFGFRPAEFFQLDAAEAAAVHQAPKVKF